MGPVKENSAEVPVLLRTQAHDETEVANAKLKDFSEGQPVKSPGSTPFRCRERVSSIGCVSNNKLGLCTVDPIRLRSPTTVAAPAQDSEPSVISVEQCKHVVSELQDSMRKAIHLYHMVSTDMESSTDKDKIAGLLTETFSSMKKELDSLKDGKELERDQEVLGETQDAVVVPLSEGSSATLSSPTRFGDEQTLALLEQYSKLLLQAVERRMNRKL
uniref:MABP1/WRD62 coiled-coil domain-containing protein n=1 Tax=Sphenodon punctatus TaxID=8508 RepID=A0A8D0HR60_SPHPU